MNLLYRLPLIFGCTVIIFSASSVLAQETPAVQPFKRSATDPASIVITPGHEFAADSYVHKPLPADAQLDEHSAEYVADIQRQIQTYYKTVNVNVENFTPPVFLVGPNQPTVRVRVFDEHNPDWTFKPLQDQWLEVPLPDNFKSSPGTDKEAVIYQPSTGHYWEFWLLQPTGARIHNSAGHEVDEWGARWGGHIPDLSKNPGYYPTPPEGYKFGTQATGLPFLAGLITIDDQLKGEINHVLFISLVETLKQEYYSFPAQRSDGQIPPEKTPYVVPEGAMFRFPADLDFDKMDMDPYARMIAKAIQKYGVVVSDRAGAVVFRAENPLDRYATSPYKWIFRGRTPQEESFPAWARLRSVPWDKLQMLKLRLNKPLPATVTPTNPAPVTTQPTQ